MNKYIKFPKWLQKLLIFIKLDPRYNEKDKK
jgi:hypothetical protein